MTPKQALALVATHGVVLESARGPVPSLAEAVAGEPIRGSWWAHPKGNEIFVCSRAVRESADVLVCRLVGGKVTYVHCRLWPALVRLSGRFPANRLAAVQEVHTGTGKHVVKTTPFRVWVAARLQRESEQLTLKEAAQQLCSLLAHDQNN